jgi:DNA primase large subunit
MNSKVKIVFPDEIKKNANQIRFIDVNDFTNNVFIDIQEIGDWQQKHNKDFKEWLKIKFPTFFIVSDLDSKNASRLVNGTFNLYYIDLKKSKVGKQIQIMLNQTYRVSNTEDSTYSDLNLDWEKEQSIQNSIAAVNGQFVGDDLKIYDSKEQYLSIVDSQQVVFEELFGNENFKNNKKNLSNDNQITLKRENAIVALILLLKK